MSIKACDLKAGILFDLDGTLWNSSGCVLPVWNRVLSRHPELNRQITAAELASAMGLTLEEISRMLLPDQCPEIQASVMQEICAEEVEYLRSHGAILYPGVPETLHALMEHYSLFLVSNCQDGYAEAFFSYHGLGGCFSDYETSGRTGLAKADNIRLILQRSQIGRAVYVGDTLGDEHSAADAGIPFIHCAYGFGKALHPNGIIHCFSKLPEAVQTVFSCQQSRHNS